MTRNLPPHTATSSLLPRCPLSLREEEGDAGGARAGGDPGRAGATSSEPQRWLSRRAAGGPGGARRLQPLRTGRGGRGCCWPQAFLPERRGARHQLELSGGEGEEGTLGAEAGF